MSKRKALSIVISLIVLFGVLFAPSMSKTDADQTAYKVTVINSELIGKGKEVRQDLSSGRGEEVRSDFKFNISDNLSLEQVENSSAIAFDINSIKSHVSSSKKRKC